MILLYLLLDDCAELTVRHTYAALDTLALVDSHSRQFLARCCVICLADSGNRAVSCAKTAAYALFLFDLEAQQALADTCRALLVDDMSFILISERLESRKNRVRSGLTECAQ